MIPPSCVGARVPCWRNLPLEAALARSPALSLTSGALAVSAVTSCGHRVFTRTHFLYEGFRPVPGAQGWQHRWVRVLRMSPGSAPRAAFPVPSPPELALVTCLLILPPASSLSSPVPGLCPHAFPPVPALLLSLAGRNTGLSGTQFGAGPSLPPPRPWETCLALAEEEVAAAVEHVAVASPEASVLFSLCAFVMPRPEEATARLRALEGPTRHPERPKHAFPGGSYATPAVSERLAWLQPLLPSPRPRAHASLCRPRGTDVLLRLWPEAVCRALRAPLPSAPPGQSWSLVP